MDNPYKTVVSTTKRNAAAAKITAIEDKVEELVKLVQDSTDIDWRDKEWINMNSEAMVNWCIDTRNRLLQVFIEPEP
jgi:hypothetical protein